MADTETPETEAVNPFDAVRSKINFEGFTKLQQEDIRDQLEQSYNAEDGTTGREMIDAGVALPNGLTIHNSNSQEVITDIIQDQVDDYITKNPGVSLTPADIAAIDQSKLDLLNGTAAVPVNLSSDYAFTGTGDVYISAYPSLETDAATGKETTEVYDFPGMTRIGQSADGQPPIQSVDHNGVVYDVPPIQTLLHEANHAIRNEIDIDGNDTFNRGEYYTPAIVGTTTGDAIRAYRGANEDTTQTMLEEMGQTQMRGSYMGTNGLEDSPAGTDYGLDQEHDVAITPYTDVDMTNHGSVGSVVVSHSLAELQAADPSFSAGNEANTFKLGDRADTVHAFDGNDTVHTGGGDDRVFLGAGDDTAHAGWGNNTIDGGDANLDPASDHRSDAVTDWGFDTVSYQTLPKGFAPTNALAADATFDGVGRDGVLITMDADDISINKGQQYSVVPEDSVDTLHNMDAIIGTGRDDLTDVSALSGERGIDAAGGIDTLRFPDTMTNTPGPVTFNGAAYDGVLSDGADKLYYTGYENVVPAAVAPASTPLPTPAPVNDGRIPPIDSSLDGAPSPHVLPMENAVRILHEEGAEAVDIERASGITDGPISTMIKTPAGASVMETLVAHGDTSVEVDAAAMEGDAYSRVSSVLKGSMERVQDLDKVAEAEGRNADHLEELAEATHEAAPAHHNIQVAESEMEYEYGA